MIKYLLLGFLLTSSLAVNLESDSDTPIDFSKPELSDVEMVNAGASIAINENFFTKLLTDLLPNMLKLIGEEFITTKIYEINLDMVTIFISQPNLTINNITYDKKKTYADLYSNNNSIGFHIVDSLVNLTLKYDVFTDPPLIDDIGEAEFGYNDLNLDLIFGMGTKQEDPNEFEITVSQSDFSLDARSVRIDLTNQNDFNKLVVSVINAILPPIANLVGTAVSEYLQNGVDLVIGLLNWPMNIKGIELDFSFKDLPVVTDDDYLSITTVGKVSPADTDLPFVNSAQLPKWLPDGKDFQVFISDFTIRSALATVAQQDLLKLSITPNDTKIMTTSYLSSFFPELVTKFGKNKPCVLDIRLLADPLPDLSITPKGIDTSLSLMMRLNVDQSTVEEDNFEEAFTFKVNANVRAILDIEKDLTIKMKINDLKVKVTDIISSNIGNIDTKKVNNVMSLLLNLIKTLVNTLLSNGIDLGIFLRNLPVALKDIMISPRTGYYMIMANPYFEKDSFANFLKYLNENQHMLKSSSQHSEMIRKSLGKGFSAFYETFDKHIHLNRPGAAPLRALINAFEIYKPFIMKDEE